MWKTTFDGVSNGTINQYEAYENMKALEAGYDELSDDVSAVKIPKELTKFERDHLASYKKNLSNASSQRAFAASKAKEMFNTLDMSPENVSTLKNIVDYSDIFMMKAVVSILSVKNSLKLDKSSDQ